MACTCEKCGAKVYDCGERLCDRCFIEECCKSDAEKNLFVGGNFYATERQADSVHLAGRSAGHNVDG